MSGTATELGTERDGRRPTAEPGATSASAAGSELMTLPATMVSSLASVHVTGHQAGVVEGGRGHRPRAGRRCRARPPSSGPSETDVGRPRSRGRPRRRRRIGADDVARDDGRVVGLGARRRGPGRRRRGRVEGIGLGQVDDVGHGHDARDRCETHECDLAARGQLRIDLGSVLMTLPASISSLYSLGDVADLEAGVLDGGDGLVLARAR